jgi:hypothetical protein
MDEELRKIVIMISPLLGVDLVPHLDKYLKSLEDIKEILERLEKIEKDINELTTDVCILTNLD